MIRVAWVASIALAVAIPRAVAAGPEESPQAALEQELKAAETAFAKTMADRDHAAFTSFLADDAVFVGQSVLRGRGAVAAAWKPLFEGPQAPFSWAPDTALVLASGTLGLTSGPVYDPQGKRTGTFNSTWRREPDGKWKVVFDKGCPRQ